MNTQTNNDQTNVNDHIEINTYCTPDDLPEIFKNDIALCSYWNGETLVTYEYENK